MSKVWLRAMAVVVVILALNGTGDQAGDSAGIFHVVLDPAALSLLAFAGLGFFRKQ